MQSPIVSDRIILRRYEAGFAPLLFAAAHESRGGEFARWMPWCREDYTLTESESFISHSIRMWENEIEYNFGIFEADTDDFLGGIGLNQFNRQHNFANLGYWVRISRQNSGIASAATRLLTAAAFEELPINRIEILAAFENEPSQRAAEKAGARREGILRSRLLIGDRVHDAVMFSYVRQDFPFQT